MTFREITQEELSSLLAEHPNLNGQGYGRVRGEGADYLRAELDRDLVGIQACADWLSQWPTQTPTNRNSRSCYGLKHAVEDFYKGTIRSNHVYTGSLIAAALIMELPVKFDGDALIGVKIPATLKISG